MLLLISLKARLLGVFVKGTTKISALRMCLVQTKLDGNLANTRSATDQCICVSYKEYHNLDDDKRVKLCQSQLMEEKLFYEKISM